MTLFICFLYVLDQAYCCRGYLRLSHSLFGHVKEAPGMSLPDTPGIFPLGSNYKTWGIDICMQLLPGDTGDLEQATRRQ